MTCSIWESESSWKQRNALGRSLGELVWRAGSALVRLEGCSEAHVLRSFLIPAAHLEQYPEFPPPERIAYSFVTLN